MAYNVYFACDECGETFCWTNFTVTYNRAVKYARKRGWTVGKRGWHCPECKAKRRKERKNND